MRPTVTVIGDALLDVRVRPSGEVRFGANVPAAITTAPGGQGANIAVRLARRGVPVSLVCGLADDTAGAMARSELDDAGVRVLPIPVPTTGTVVILGDPGGERTMMSQRASFAGRLDRLEPAANPAWLIVSGYLLLEPDAAGLGDVLPDGARRVLAGCAVPADLLSAWRSTAAAIAPDLIVVNREEARDLELAESDGVVLTDAGGATARIGGVSAEATVVPGDPVVDTTGAGDAFIAALVGSLVAAPWPPAAATLRGALEAGVELASAVTRVVGAQTPVPSEPSTATLDRP